MSGKCCNRKNETITFVWLIFSVLLSCTTAFTCPTRNGAIAQVNSRTVLHMNSREDEIRRKIMKLKKEGRIKKTDDSTPSSPAPSTPTSEEDAILNKIREKRDSLKGDVAGEYEDKIKAKLGGNRKVSLASMKMGREIVSGSGAGSSGAGVKSQRKQEEDAAIDEEDDEDDDIDLEEEEIMEMVAQKLAEKKLKDKPKAPTERGISSSPPPPTSTTKKTTSGIGGAWSKNTTATEESYRPSRGSWGYFPRPKDISKAYGGGKRVGAGVQIDDEESRLKAEEATRERLRQYREKVGIDVQSEKDHAEEIDQALALGSRAMMRGMYSTAVSCLEKVTKYCSTNSKVGGKVFLELAMAYEASGQTKEAVTVYTALSKSRIEEIKFNAQRLLYGIEAMNFMRDELRSEAFSRKKIRNTFIDTTGLANIADNFDVVYNTAYIDLDKGGKYYKKLSESMVRSPREARQILLKARNSGDVERLKIVQALRSISRNFDDALKQELISQEENEPVALLNGVPIKPSQQRDEKDAVRTMDQFMLASSDQMLENLNGEWRLQLMADKKGDGVKYFNTTLAWQMFDTLDTMQYQFFSSSSGFLSAESRQSGTIDFNAQQRALSRDNDKTSSGGGSWLSVITGAAKTGPGAALSPQQILMVDSVLCITRSAVKPKVLDENIKDYFCVWRRVESGTYSSK